MKLFAQYLWVDEPRSLNNETGGWQSGVRFADGRAKPSLKHFAMPFAHRRRPRTAVGAGPHARDAHRQGAETKLAGSSSWKTIGTRKTDSQGYWSWTTRLSVGASYRFQAAGATSATVTRR